MVTVESLSKSAESMVTGMKKHVLTTEEAKARLRSSIQTHQSRMHKVFFFTDHYTMGVTIPEWREKHLTASSTGMPWKITPREGFEDGYVHTLEGLIQLSYSDYKQITTVEELLDFLNTP